MPGTRAWKESWTRANNQFYLSIDVPLDDFIITMDPQHYYYWNGLKIMNLEMTLQLKLSRYIPSDFVDFIILKEIYPNLTKININLDRNEIWQNKTNRSIKTINKLIIQSFERYLIKDKRRINIKKYLL